MFLRMQNPYSSSIRSGPLQTQAEGSCTILMKKIVFICFIFILASCQQNPDVSKTHSLEQSAKAAGQKNPSLFVVRHVVRSNDLYVECFVPDITFMTKSNQKKRGKAVVSIDGVRYGEYRTAAFVIESLPSGTHLINIEIKDTNNHPLGLRKQFYVTVP
ncbi:hypothetical protein [Bacillus smithii]|uniref:hypothetical protein n=1 Tax=Bacillus smithii TaxID=1479 RepID=UPI0022E3734A|nr:hypothetical protein [Bacillus smithii]